MNVFVFSGTKVTTKEERLDALQKSRVGRHHVFKLAVLRTSLAHDNASVGFEYLGFDFTGMLVHQSVERNFTGDDGVANLFYTRWTKTVCLARKPQRRCGAFVGFEQGTGSPVGPDGFTFRKPLVNALECFPGDVGKTGD